MATYQVTDEHIFVFKCNLVILDLLPSILRTILANEIDEKNICNVAQGHRAVLRLGKEQWQKIRTCVYSNLDITILYQLIRHVTKTDLPTKGWGVASPLTEQYTIGDVVEQIKLIRNETFGHLPEARMLESKFQKTWKRFNEICEAMDALSLGNNYSDQLKGISEVEFNPEKAEQLEERRKADVKHDKEIEEFRVQMQIFEKRLSETEKAMLSTQLGTGYSLNEEDKVFLKSALLEQYEGSVNIIPISPRVQNFGLPIDKLFIPLKIKEKVSIKSHQPLSRHESNAFERRILTSYDELLSRRNQGVHRIFLYGDAGSGKTCYTLRMVNLWAKGKPESYEGIPWSIEKELLQIDFVFHIAMKYLSGDDDNVEDIVCNDFLLSQNDDKIRGIARRALRSPQIRCLVIMDGLDEWPKNKLPSTVRLRNCQVLFTSRHSKIATMNLKYEETDRIGKLQSFKQDDIEQLVPIILQLFLKIDIDTPEFTIKVEEILEKLRSPYLQHISRKPFLATYLVILLNNNPKACDSVTSLYLEIINILIQRAMAENRFSSATDSGLRGPSKRKQTFKLQSFNDKHFNALLQIGCYALEILLKEMKKPVLQVLGRSKPLDNNVVDFGIETGILRKSIIPEMTRSIRKYDFLHRSILEILAAMFLVYEDSTDKLQVFLQSLSNVDEMLHAELFCTFIAGLDPHCGKKLQKHLTRLCKSYFSDDQTKFPFHHDIRPRMRTAYDLFCNLFLETSSGEFSSRSHVTHGWQVDVYIDEDTDEKVRNVTFLILEKLKDNVSSIFIENSSEDENVSFENVLDKFLVHQQEKNVPTSFQHLYIRRLHLKSTKFTSLTTLVLRDVRIGNETKSNFTHSIQANPHLKNLRLGRIYCEGLNHFIYLRFHESATLESLTLEAIQLTSSSFVSIQSIVQVSTSLKILRLAEINESNVLSKRKVFDFHLENKSDLKELYLHDIKIDPGAFQCRRGFLASNVKLTEIHLDKITYGRGDLVIPSKNYLRTLHLAEIELSRQSIDNLTILIRETPELEVLILDAIRYEDTMLELDLSRKEHLRVLCVSSMELENVRLFENMHALSNVYMIEIAMCGEDWNMFLSDLINIQHAFDIDLKNVNIDDGHIQFINDSQHFSVVTSTTWHNHISFSRSFA